MARVTKSTLLVLLFCVLDVLNNLKAETENGTVAFSSHRSSIEISPHSSNGASRSYPIVLKNGDATPKLLQKVPAAKKIVTGANFQEIHKNSRILTLTSVKYVSLRKVIPGEKRMTKNRPITQEMEGENSKTNCCCCCGFDLYSNFVKDDWQAHQDNMQSAIYEQTICAERENIAFPGPDGYETVILRPT